MQKNKALDNNITRMSLSDLRQEWAKAWRIKPHERIGRITLERSLSFKLRELHGEWLNEDQQKRLDQLISSYKRNPKFFEEKQSELKPGLRLIKNYKGEHHSVEVLVNGYKYRDKIYGSLSEVASTITGTRWNGWVFFGLKKREKKS